MSLLVSREVHLGAASPQAQGVAAAEGLDKAADGLESGLLELGVSAAGAAGAGLSKLRQMRRAKCPQASASGAARAKPSTSCRSTPQVTKGATAMRNAPGAMEARVPLRGGTPGMAAGGRLAKAGSLATKGLAVVGVVSSAAELAGAGDGVEYSRQKKEDFINTFQHGSLMDKALLSLDSVGAVGAAAGALDELGESDLNQASQEASLDHMRNKTRATIKTRLEEGKEVAEEYISKYDMKAFAERLKQRTSLTHEKTNVLAQEGATVGGSDSFQALIAPALATSRSQITEKDFGKEAYGKDAAEW